VSASDDEDEDFPLPGWLIDEAAVAPDAALEALERQRLVRGVIDRLPADKRDVIRLVYEAQLEVTEVAERLGVPEGTVKSRLYYARRQVAAGWRRVTREWEDDSQ
jgi:RNA polymerase sigma-70 factor (ECF subfamily)